MNDERSRDERATSYRAAGVDIEAGDRVKRHIAELVARTHGPEVIRGLGLFGGFFRAPGANNSVVLVSSADSVGTKIMVAQLVGRHETIGIDLVNHCVNDILACGARPLFFLDYFAASALDPDVFEQLVSGMARACQDAGCALIGGETAQLPGIYREGVYDLAGFVVGAVEEDRIVDGSAVRPGDVLIGLASSGLHTNGFSLARAALGLDAAAPEAVRRLQERPSWSDRTLGELLLEPHRSYLADVSPLVDKGRARALAHITGGGIAGNVARVIPEGAEAVIDVTAWEVPRLFRTIQDAGGIDDGEMYRVFNMGIGFVIVADANDAEAIMKQLDGAQVIGRIERSERGGARYTGLSGETRG